VNQAKAKSNQPENFSRSETAPEIRATVMTANIIWKTMKTYVGMPVPAPRKSHSSPMKFVCVPKYWVKLPITLLAPALSLVPNARVKP
jgi:hypothetical protein